MGNPYAPRKSANAAQKASEPVKAQESVNDTEKTLEAQSAPQGEAVKASETAKTESIKVEVPDTTIEGTLDWVGDDKERASLAIEAENAKPKPRKTLINKLEEV